MLFKRLFVFAIAFVFLFGFLHSMPNCESGGPLPRTNMVLDPSTGCYINLNLNSVSMTPILKEFYLRFPSNLSNSSLANKLFLSKVSVSSHSDHRIILVIGVPGSNDAAIYTIKPKTGSVTLENQNNKTASIINNVLNIKFVKSSSDSASDKLVIKYRLNFVQNQNKKQSDLVVSSSTTITNPWTDCILKDPKHPGEKCFYFGNSNPKTNKIAEKCKQAFVSRTDYRILDNALGVIYYEIGKNEMCIKTSDFDNFFNALSSLKSTPVASTQVANTTYSEVIKDPWEQCYKPINKKNERCYFFDISAKSNNAFGGFVNRCGKAFLSNKDYQWLSNAHAFTDYFENNKAGLVTEYKCIKETDLAGYFNTKDKSTAQFSTYSIPPNPWSYCEVLAYPRKHCYLFGDDGMGLAKECKIVFTNDNDYRTFFNNKMLSFMSNASFGPLMCINDTDYVNYFNAKKETKKVAKPLDKFSEENKGNYAKIKSLFRKTESETSLAGLGIKVLSQYYDLRRKMDYLSIDPSITQSQAKKNSSKSLLHLVKERDAAPKGLIKYNSIHNTYVGYLFEWYYSHLGKDYRLAIAKNIGNKSTFGKYLANLDQDIDRVKTTKIVKVNKSSKHATEVAHRKCPTTFPVSHILDLVQYHVAVVESDLGINTDNDTSLYFINTNDAGICVYDAKGKNINYPLTDSQKKKFFAKAYESIIISYVKLTKDDVAFWELTPDDFKYYAKAKEKGKINKILEHLKKYTSIDCTKYPTACKKYVALYEQQYEKIDAYANSKCKDKKPDIDLTKCMIAPAFKYIQTKKFLNQTRELKVLEHKILAYKTAHPEGEKGQAVGEVASPSNKTTGTPTFNTKLNGQQQKSAVSQATTEPAVPQATPASDSKKPGVPTSRQQQKSAVSLKLTDNDIKYFKKSKKRYEKEHHGRQWKLPTRETLFDGNFLDCTLYPTACKKYEALLEKQQEELDPYANDPVAEMDYLNKDGQKNMHRQNKELATLTVKIRNYVRVHPKG